MICRNCGQESNGNYCSHCGAPLKQKEKDELEREVQKEEKEEQQEIYRTKRPRKKVQTKDSNMSSSANTSKRGKKKSRKRRKKKKRSLPSPTGIMPVKTMKKTISRVLQLASVAFMGVIGAILIKSMISEKNTLGSLSTMVSEKNYALALFYGIMISMIGFAILSIAWILSKKKIASEERIKSFDSGRGVIPFFCYAVAVLLAPELLKIVPEAHEVVKGFQLAMEILTEEQKIIGTCSVLGIVSCFIRKFMRI